jgi:hypothetical protein
MIFMVYALEVQIPGNLVESFLGRSPESEDEETDALVEIQRVMRQAASAEAKRRKAIAKGVQQCEE